MSTATQTPEKTDSFAAYLECDLDLYVVSAEHENRLWLAKQSLNALCWMFGAVEDAARPMAAHERHKANITVPSESMQCLLQMLKDQIDSVSLVSYRRVAAARESLADQSIDDLTPATH